MVKSSNYSSDEFKELVDLVFNQDIDLSDRPKTDISVEKEVADPLSELTANLFDELTALTEKLEPGSDRLDGNTPEEPVFTSVSINEPQTTAKPVQSTNFKEIFALLAISLLVFILANLVFIRVRVAGPSMEPSISHNDLVMINRFSYDLTEIQRGDVIAFEDPNTSSQLIVKRVIAMPGDRIEIVGGWIYINDVLLDEPYLGTPELFDYPEVTIPPGMIFVLGDNRTVSSDSREWGPLVADSITGRVDFIYWPLNSFGLIEHYHSSVFEFQYNE